MVIPGRNCVARILSSPDAYGVLRQAVQILSDFQAMILGVDRAVHDAGRTDAAHSDRL
jgi:hypothetical protein